MTRSTVAGLDAAVIARAAVRGVHISPFQIERWRRDHYLPRRRPGRPRTTDTEDLTRTVELAVLLAQACRQGRSAGSAGWYAWAVNATPEATSRLRKALLDALDAYGARFAAGPDDVLDDEDAAHQARYEAAAAFAARMRRGPDMHALLTDALHGAGAPPLPPGLPSAGHPQVAQVAARLLGGGAEHIGADEFIEGLRAAWPQMGERLDAAERAYHASERAEDDARDCLWATSPLAGGWAGFRSAIADADPDVLCRVVEMNMATAFTRDAVVFLGRTLAGRPVTAQDCARALSDPMWEEWGRHVPPFFSSDNTVRTAIVFQSALALLMPGRIDDLARYRHLLEELVQGRTPGDAVPAARG